MMPHSRLLEFLQKERKREEVTRHLSHPEHQLQVVCVRWFNLQYSKYRGLLFAVPNGAMLNGNRNQRMLAGKRLRDEGMVKGVADLLLLVPNSSYHGLCVEMKAARGVQKEEQRHWATLVEAQGYKYVVVKPCKEKDGFEMFRDVIKEYLK